MLGIGTALVGFGLDFVKDLIMDNGEDLVKEGIKKVTGIDLTKKKPQELSKEDILAIKNAESEIKMLNFKELQLELDSKKEDYRHDEANRNKAHDTYQIKNEMADTIASRIISRNLPYIALLVITNLILIYFMKTEVALLAIASNIIGITIGNLFAERQAIVNFFFGSSIGSKTKSKHIEKVNNV